MANEPMRNGSKPRLPALTGVRAFAAVMVLALHAGQNFPQFLSDNDIVQRGYLGVDLFFLLSGFIIAHVYLRDLVPIRAQPLRIFLWHRFVRLFPVHATVLLGLVALLTAGRSAGVDFNEPQNWNYSDLPWHFLMVHAWGTTAVAGWNAPSWSISAEWFAYLLFPAVAAGVLALPRRGVLPFALAILTATAVLFHIREWTIGSAWIGTPALARVAMEFICGVLLYRALRIDRGDLSPLLSDGLAFGGLLGFCTGALLSLNDIMLIALLVVIISGVSGPGLGVRFVFACRPVVWLGEISYSIYVVHFPILLILRHGAEHILPQQLAESNATRAMMFVASLAIVIGVASLLYYTVEYPTRAHLRNLFGKIVPAKSQYGAALASETSE
jgi:peptidoglycan/LPS O-acetylase OafA/YrhL